MSARSSFPFCTHQCSQLPQIVHVYSSLSLFPLFPGLQILCPVSSYTMLQHIPWPWWWCTIIIFQDKFVLRLKCVTSFTVHIWFLQNVYTPNNCRVLHNTFFIGNCEHWWVQKGKDDLADISVIFFLYGPNHWLDYRYKLVRREGHLLEF